MSQKSELLNEVRDGNETREHGNCSIMLSTVRADLFELLEKINAFIDDGVKIKIEMHPKKKQLDISDAELIELFEKKRKSRLK
jgi:hypothetical protein